MNLSPIIFRLIIVYLMIFLCFTFKSDLFSSIMIFPPIFSLLFFLPPLFLMFVFLCVSLILSTTSPNNEITFNTPSNTAGGVSCSISGNSFTFSHPLVYLQGVHIIQNNKNKNRGTRSNRDTSNNTITSADNNTVVKKLTLFNNIADILHPHHLSKHLFFLMLFNRTLYTSKNTSLSISNHKYNLFAPNHFNYSVAYRIFYMITQEERISLNLQVQEISHREYKTVEYKVLNDNSIVLRENLNIKKIQFIDIKEKKRYELARKLDSESTSNNNSGTNNSTAGIKNNSGSNISYLHLQGDTDSFDVRVFDIHINDSVYSVFRSISTPPRTSLFIPFSIYTLEDSEILKPLVFKIVGFVFVSGLTYYMLRYM